MENYKIVTVHDWNDRNDDYIYHYTDVNSAIKILEQKVVLKTQARIPSFGSGVFMTELSPKKSDAELIQNNYRGNGKYASRVECAFAFKKKHLNATKFIDKMEIGRDLWRKEDHVFLTDMAFALVVRKEHHFYLVSDATLTQRILPRPNLFDSLDHLRKLLL